MILESMSQPQSFPAPSRAALRRAHRRFRRRFTNPLQETFEAFAASLDIELQDLAFTVLLPLYAGGSDDMVERFEKGMLDEAIFSRELARRLRERVAEPVEADGLIDKIFAGVRLEPVMLDALVATRRRGMKTALLSNSWGMAGYPTERFEELFDAVVISGEVGLRKPEPAIYELTVSRLDVPAARCVFVDDHPGHLPAAQTAGMTTVLHISPEQTLAQLSDLLGVPLWRSEI